MKSKNILMLSIVMVVLSACSAGLRFNGGHSHNDYVRSRPLFDALENGMVSVEADIYYRNGKVLVGHDPEDLTVDRTLQGLYLDPLLKMAQKKDNALRQIILLIDVKENGEETYEALKRVFAPYEQVFTRYENGKLIKNTITVILSGNRPVEVVRREPVRFVFIDGRVNDKDLKESSLLFPLISDAWSTHFTWKGEGKMPEPELLKLRQMVKECHEKHKMLRFWGLPTKSPQMENVWEELASNQVDLIGTDCPVCLRDFLTGRTAGLNKKADNR
ncbi:MAG: phosphatidylinositol-specific phospholipase C/glycerophosphodiester phosphodiesterase family protein [Bacteroidales bacterium]